MPFITSSGIILSTAQLGDQVVATADLQDQAVTNAKVNNSAAIVDTKLAQITTASKVSGAALTSLSSVPAGAGVIPAANIPQGFAELANVSAGGASPTLASGTFAAKQYLRILINLVDVAAGSELRVRFNGDSTAIYSKFQVLNGGAGAGTNAASGLEVESNGGTFDYPFVIDCDVICNIATVRKSGILRTVAMGNAGSVAPNAFNLMCWTFNDTTNQITSVSLVSSSGNITAGSTIMVLGSAT